MRFEAATNTYVGVVSQLPLDTRAAVQATAIDRAGRSVMKITSVSLSPIPPNVDANLFSSDGQLSLTIPAGALPGGARVAIGSNAPTPVLDTGAEIVSGPFNVLSSTGRRLNRPAVLRFQLTPPSDQGSPISRFDPKSFEVLHFDAASARWERAGGTFLEAVAVVTVPIRELGAYLLIARLRMTPTPTQEFKVVGTSLLASQPKYQGSCPATISCDGFIETNGPGTVEYIFVRNDGATSSTRTLTFKSAGKLPVINSWSIGGAALPSYSGWQAVKILSPNPRGI